MKYEVMVAGPGGFEFVIVDAETGDDAAAKAWRPGTQIRGVHPAPEDAVEAPAPRTRKVAG